MYSALSQSTATTLLLCKHLDIFNPDNINNNSIIAIFHKSLVYQHVVSSGFLKDHGKKNMKLCYLRTPQPKYIHIFEMLKIILMPDMDYYFLND